LLLPLEEPKRFQKDVMRRDNLLVSLGDCPVVQDAAQRHFVPPTKNVGVLAMTFFLKMRHILSLPGVANERFLRYLVKIRNPSSS